MNTNVGLRKSKIRGDKKVVYSLSLIMLLALSLMLSFAQPGLAQVGVSQPIETNGYISVAPTLVGVGQSATVTLWVYPMPTNYLYQAYYDGFTGIEVTFVKPDGTKDTFMPTDGTGQYAAGTTESLGIIYFNYEPDMAGDWSVSFTMPVQNVTDWSGTVIYSGCTSMTAYFTVQEDPVLAGLLNGYPWAELPDENTFWSYPINSNNREWSQISGDYLGGSSVLGATCLRWQPYGSAPNTGHIVWSQPLKAGGIIGGDYGSLSYSTVIGSIDGIVIMDGKLFINIPNTNQFECIDLATGETLYTASGQINSGIHLPGNPSAQALFDSSVSLASSYGSTTTSYLFEASGSTWNFYDPFTGTLKMSIANVTAGGYKLVDGSNLAFGTRSGTLFAWDLSKVIYDSFLNYYMPAGTVFTGDWPAGITWNVTLPTSLIGSSPSFFGLSTDASVIVLKTTNQYWGYSAKDGTQLWNYTLPYPGHANEQICLYGVDDFIVFDVVDTTFHCYSMITGAELWVSESFADSPWATTWTVYQSETNDYDNFYTAFPDGTMVALSLKTGETVWRSEAIPSTEYTNNVVPFVCGMLLDNGNLYGYAGYSTGYQINPIPRQAMIVCINATTGDITYTLNGGIYPNVAANGYIIGTGIFDGNLYCIGKGQTSTSVTIQNNVVTNHATALITGNVLDQSPVSAGTQAVADASMSEWMDYLHMQNSTLLNNPPTPEGVQVTLTALYPDGSTQTIGTTTTNSKGNYAVSFVPNMTGMYTITASFAGTSAYYSSDSETQLSVVAASETTPNTVTQTTADNTMLLYGIMVLVVVAIILAALALIRKK
ncbi:MAG: PQQ-binding-like beta-propeller repeat protein [Candidatus Bathyarchaeia archaeon]|jgi:hypothetical protein